MKKILVLSSLPGFVETIQSCLAVEEWRVVHRLSLEEAEPLLVHQLVQACVLDADQLGVETIWCIDKIRRHNERIPVIIFTGSSPAEWEEEALLRGVSQILMKPVSPRLLKALLDRILPGPAGLVSGHVSPAGSGGATRSTTELPVPGRSTTAAPTLAMLRDFSGILMHSLDANAMLKQFLQFLRETMSINRAAIFLERPVASPEAMVAPADNRRLRATASIGLSGSLLEHFELSLDSGIGFQISRLGRIIRRDSEELRADAEAQKEFELLGAQIAVPITNRDTTIGVAIFDGRITGEPLVNSELELIFHLLEQAGLALRNISLHDQIAASHETMTSVLRELNGACIVVGRDLRVLHANRAVGRLLGRRSERTARLDFSDLPPLLGSKIYQVLNTGAALEPFRYEPEQAPGNVFKISIIPLRHGNAAVPVSALLTAEDLTESEQLSRLESEAAKLRLLHSMSNRLVNEIPNAIAPVSVHHQLLAESFDDPEFRKSLDVALGESVKRIMRLSNQMKFLAREGHLEIDTFPVETVVEESFTEATRQSGQRNAQLKLEKATSPMMFTGDRVALKHALSEILLNALQANPKNPKITVSLSASTNENEPALILEVRDNGTGFHPDTAKKIPAPFYTTRVVGLGLGLAVSQKIIETHNGRLEIIPSETGIVRVVLPLEAKTN